MGKKRILVIDGSGGEVFASGHDGPVLEQRFETRAGTAPEHFDQWLQTHPTHGQFIVIADLADERFALEHIPRAGLGDARAMTRRRLQQHFPDTAFTVAVPLGRQAGQPRLDALLLAALTRPAMLEPWLRALTDAGKVITRVLTPALLFDQWQRPASRKRDTFLLINITRTGMRQTLFVDGRLRFSRLAPPRAATLRECMAAYANELAQTHAYLTAQHWIGHGASALTLKLLADTADHATLVALANAIEGAELDFLPLDGWARPRHADPLTGHSDARPFMLRQAFKCPPAVDYTPPALKARRKQTQVRAALPWIVGASYAGLLLAIGAEWLTLQKLQQEDARIQSAAVATRQELDRLQQADTALAVPTTDAAAWVETISALEGRSVTPALVMHLVSQIMEAVPAWRLERLRWALQPASPDSGESSHRASSLPPSVAIELETSGGNPHIADTGADVRHALELAAERHPGLVFTIGEGRLSARAPDNRLAMAGDDGNSRANAPHRRLSLHLPLPAPGQTTEGDDE
ncbi:hypothetical protein J5J83_19475 [Azoarcus sp. L1K30]|uniref:hypothetical protein n=1 Tax=Azoarcus sp. L1K30 TaxID=2820277 RepID=UPI001B81A2BA|nr:hypothetical protein [Azoarcus sp. L1K30]MBR0568307.1 hypothetical protein [Azoarcus sp. L1K30]